MKGDSEAEVDAVEYECSQAITLREASANFCDHNHTKEDFEIAKKDIGAGWRAKVSAWNAEPIRYRLYRRARSPLDVRCKRRNRIPDRTGWTSRQRWRRNRRPLFQRAKHRRLIEAHGQWDELVIGAH